MIKRVVLAYGLTAMIFLAACAPEVGSDAWCEEMDETATGDWSANDAKAYAQNCVFRKSNDD